MDSVFGRFVHVADGLSLGENRFHTVHARIPWYDLMPNGSSVPSP